MSNYTNLAALFATTDNATHVVNNTAHDDDVVTVATTIDWFTFNNIVVANLYVSGNSWVGLGSNSETSAIKVDRRDAKLWDLWTETGTVGDYYTYRFYRIRWSGYGHYNSTDTANKLVWDLVLLDNGQIFLNILNWPSSYADGTNALVTANTCSFAASSAVRQFTFTRTDTAGTTWTSATGINEPDYSAILYLYSDLQGYVYYYTKADNTFTKLEGLTKDKLTSADFTAHGSADAAQWSFVKEQLTHPVILKWTNSNLPANIKATLKGIPVAQVISSMADLSNSTIKGIKSLTSVYEGSVMISYSYDNLTWADPVNMADFLLTDVNTLYDNLTAEKKIYFKVKLMDATSKFTNFVMTYIN